jgi:hypothetical protein
LCIGVGTFIECYADKKSTTVQVLKELFEDHHTIFKTFLPKDLQGLVRADYGIEVPYHTCWRAIRAIDEAKQHVNDASFQYIEAFFSPLLKAIQEQLQASNVVKKTHFFLASCVPELRKKRFLIVCL